MTVLRELALGGALAQNADKTEPLSLDGLVMQPKLDGWRVLAEVCEDHVRFYTRTGSVYTGKIPQVEKELLRVFPAGSWLDGEAVSDGGWGSVQSEMTKSAPKALSGSSVSYVVFDLLSHRNIDARSLSHAKRRTLLERIFTTFKSDWVSLIPEFPASDEVYADIVVNGGEGVVIKNPAAPYASGKRGRGWSKRKAKDTLDMIVMGFEDGTDVGAVVLGQYTEEGILLKRTTAKRKPNLIPDTSAKWIGTVVETEHNGIMPSGAPRHPRMLRVRIDKPAVDCVWV